MRALRQRECHAGKSNKISEHYDDLPKRYELCSASHLQHASKRLSAYDIVYSIQNGVTQFPEDLVRSSPDDADIWQRCGDTSRMSVHEQIQQLDYMQRWKTLLNFLSRNRGLLQQEVTILNEKIAEILGYDPKITDRK